MTMRRVLVSLGEWLLWLTLGALSGIVLAILWALLPVIGRIVALALRHLWHDVLWMLGGILPW